MKKLEKLPEWEHKIIIDKNLGYSIMDEINQLGQQGWEIVSSVSVVFEGSTTQINYLFKRLKIQS
jgi:hypothetical protein